MAAPAPPSGIVTLLFSDIEGSTRPSALDRRGVSQLLERHRMLLRRAFERHGGHVLGTEGDQFFVAFESAGDVLAGGGRGCPACARRGGVAGRQPGPGPHGPPPARRGSPRAATSVWTSTRRRAEGGRARRSGPRLRGHPRAVGPTVELRDLGEHALRTWRTGAAVPLVLEGLPNEFPPLRTLDTRFRACPRYRAFVGRARARRGRGAARTGRGAAADTHRDRRNGQDAAGARDGGGHARPFPDGVDFALLTPVREC